jgi:hypothetical protein
MVCLLRAIQNRLDVTPETTKEFYGSLMVGLASRWRRMTAWAMVRAPNAWATAFADA